MPLLFYYLGVVYALALNYRMIGFALVCGVLVGRLEERQSSGY